MSSKNKIINYSFDEDISQKSKENYNSLKKELDNLNCDLKDQFSHLDKLQDIYPYEEEKKEKQSDDIRIFLKTYKSNLTKIHKRGNYHTDFKPENILLAKNNPYADLSNRVDEIAAIIKLDVAKKGDVHESTFKIIENQNLKIKGLEKTIKDLFTEIEKRSIANIFTFISIFGLVVSIPLLFLSIIYDSLTFSKNVFILSTSCFILFFIMARLSKKI